jgi:hypothetical protein
MINFNENTLYLTFPLFFLITCLVPKLIMPCLKQKHFCNYFVLLMFFFSPLIVFFIQ